MTAKTSAQPAPDPHATAGGCCGGHRTEPDTPRNERDDKGSADPRPAPGGCRCGEN